MATVENVACSRVRPGNNDRKTFDPAALQELAASIAAHGLAQPITVRPVPPGLDGTDLEIVAGERRFRAISQVLGWDTVPAIIRDLSDEEAAAIMLAENTSRADLDPIEEASAYASRIAQFGWDPARCGQVAGVSEDLVKRRISLLRLVAEVQHLVKHGHMPVGHAEAITDLDPNRQRIAMRIFRESKAMPLATFRHIVSQLLEEQSQESLFDLESFWVEQVQHNAELPRKGKHAVTGAPTRKDLPPPEINPRDTAAVIIDRYIADLLAAGHREEAAAIGTVYNAMVRMNYMAVPFKAALLAPNGKGA
jgi:ParB/RepB/Spo0J family partition protein